MSWSFKNYHSIKAVKAAKINTMPEQGKMLDVSVGYMDTEIEVFDDWFSRCKATSADYGYLVIYEDGYQSWSPTKAFEKGNLPAHDYKRFLIGRVNGMCEQSLDPAQFEMWEQVKKALFEVRSDLE